MFFCMGCHKNIIEPDPRYPPAALVCFNFDSARQSIYMVEKAEYDTKKKKFIYEIKHLHRSNFVVYNVEDTDLIPY